MKKTIPAVPCDRRRICRSAPASAADGKRWSLLIIGEGTSNLQQLGTSITAPAAGSPAALYKLSDAFTAELTLGLSQEFTAVTPPRSTTDHQAQHAGWKLSKSRVALELACRQIPGARTPGPTPRCAPVAAEDAVNFDHWKHGIKGLSFNWSRPSPRISTLFMT